MTPLEEVLADLDQTCRTAEALSRFMDEAVELNPPLPNEVEKSARHLLHYMMGRVERINRQLGEEFHRVVNAGEVLPDL